MARVKPLFSGSRFPQDQHIAPGIGYLLDLIDQGLNCRTLPQDVFKVIPFADLLFQQQIFRPERPLIQGDAHDPFYLVMDDRLQDVIVGTGLSAPTAVSIEA